MPAIISGTITATPNLKKAKDSSWNALSRKWRQISPKINRLSVRGHERSKTAFLSETVFNDNFCVWNDRAIILTPSCLPRQDASKHIGETREVWAVWRYGPSPCRRSFAYFSPIWPHKLVAVILLYNPRDFQNRAQSRLAVSGDSVFFFTSPSKIRWIQKIRDLCESGWFYYVTPSLT